MSTFVFLLFGLTNRPAGGKDDEIRNGCTRLERGAGQHSEDTRVNVVKTVTGRKKNNWSKCESRFEEASSRDL